MEITEEILKKLQEPFKDIKWRVQSATQDKRRCIVVPYLDARQVQQRLDDVVGISGWTNTYEAETGTSSLGIRVGDDFMYKSDVGTDSKIDKEKGKASDSFKRSAVLWGIGRDVYKIGSKMLDFDDQHKKPKTSTGKILYTPEQLSNYMNGLNTSIGLLSQIWDDNKELQADDKFIEVITSLKKYLK